jgi:hypothetical protein
MKRLQLRIRTLEFEATSDEEIGRSLASSVEKAVGSSSNSPLAVVVRKAHIDLVELGPVLERGVSLSKFLARLTQCEVDDDDRVMAVGLMGQMKLRAKKGAPTIPTALVFLEWEDSRWWHWRAHVHAPSKRLDADSVRVARAEDGLPRPTRFGGWWSLGRRRQLRPAYSRRAAPLVH